MQIELSKTTEQILTARAIADGYPLNEYIESVLCKYAAVSVQPQEHSGEYKINTFEDAIAWILLRNPKISTTVPQDTDWQALKAEGRRY